MRVSYISSPKLNPSGITYRSNETPKTTEQNPVFDLFSKEKSDVSAVDVANTIGLIGGCLWLLNDGKGAFEPWSASTSKITFSGVLSKIGEIGMIMGISANVCIWIAKKIRNDDENK